MINILIEGEGSEKEFWEKILLRYHSNLIKLMSYNGIDSLASFFDKVYSPDSDLFVISVDNVVDNPSVYEIIGEFKNDLVDKKNVIVLDLICFEDTLLNFKLLEKWMFSEEARAANKNTQERLSLLNDYRELEFKWATSAELFSFVQKWYGHISGISTENVASAVLSKVTSGTNFKTNKSTLGHCFYCDCSGCTRATDAHIPMQYHCGLVSQDNSGNLSAIKNGAAKVEDLYNYTKVHDALLDCKAELLRRGYTAANIL